MVNPMVERATSDMLVGPDWSINIGICDLCNRDPGQAKDVVKAIKKRLGSKNVKVQLLTLTLLETIVKNCGDFVHKSVAEKDLLRDMVKIVKKKPDYHVKEKILILIDTWQEAFGGARARYPQYHAAYNELLHLGALFPKRTERSPPVFTPLQTQPLMRNPQNGNEAVESSADADASNLSMTEIQHARGIIDVLAEMLIAVDPTRKEGLRQEVVVDLVQQCRTYKKRVVHLVNSTSDESLLCEGLALNDELQRVLDKHEKLVSGASAPSENSRVVAKHETPSENSRVVAKHEAPVSGVSVPSEKSKPKLWMCLLLIQGRHKILGFSYENFPSISCRPTDSACANVESPMTTSEPSSATSEKVNPKFDLLSGDDYSIPTTDNFLAIVPFAEPQPATPIYRQNLMSQNSKPQNIAQEHTYPSSPQIQHISSQNGNLPQYDPISKKTQGSIPASGQTYSQHFQSQQPSFQPNETIQNTVTPQQVSSPVSRQRFCSSPQLEQSQHFPAQQPSFSPRSPYAQGSSPTAEKTYSSSPNFQHFVSRQPSFNSNGSLTSMVPVQSEPTSPYSQGSSPAWSGHTSQQQQQPSSPVYGAQTRQGGLPPPPWEIQLEENNQLGGMLYPTPGNDTNQPMGTGRSATHEPPGGNPSPATDCKRHPTTLEPPRNPPPTRRHSATHDPPPTRWHSATHEPEGGNPSNHKWQHLLPMSHKVAINPTQQQITGGPLPPMIHQAIHVEQIPPQQQFQSVVPHYHMAYMYPQQMYGDPMAQPYGCGYGYGYGCGGGYRVSNYAYTQPQQAQLLDHRMQWLSMRDDGFLNSSTVYATPSTSNASLNPSNADDKLFQDLGITNKTTGKALQGKSNQKTNLSIKNKDRQFTTTLKKAVGVKI
ncbi:hypothetical protein OSB04_029849 [Centaurea solstitialis]|uniref:Uncharacterized protein n=1 Tax=Centaurea solstitialis TaxID=347529 RepID=A0AA38SIQ1_9ASTR|nr:hypothetical protein OSB04_029849 [Centaurea solstitialis]